MKSSKVILTAIVAIIFFIGVGSILYQSRPVVELTQEANATTETDAAISADGIYSMSEIKDHTTSDNCWAAINGSVYDLTDWVRRHPGGSRVIISLCGTDGSSAFEVRHGYSNTAQSALALFKIGTLSE